MDFSTNPNVQNGYNHLLVLLDTLEFRYGTYLWDPRYKGLDDYILAMQKAAMNKRSQNGENISDEF